MRQNLSAPLATSSAGAAGGTAPCPEAQRTQEQLRPKSTERTSRPRARTPHVGHAPPAAGRRLPSGRGCGSRDARIPAAHPDLTGAARGDAPPSAAPGPLPAATGAHRPREERCSPASTRSAAPGPAAARRASARPLTEWRVPPLTGSGSRRPAPGRAEASQRRRRSASGNRGRSPHTPCQSRACRPLSHWLPATGGGPDAKGHEKGDAGRLPSGRGGGGKGSEWR